MAHGPGSGRPTAPRGRVLCLVALLVLAGCSGPLAGADEDREPGTLTPVPVPGDAGTTDELAPGVTAEGVVDATRLGEAHARALGNVSHTLRRNVTRRATDGTLLTSTDTIVRTTTAGDRFRYTLVFQRDERRVVDRYADAGRVYERERTANATSYALLRGPEGVPLDPRTASFENATNRRGIVDLFGRFRFAVTGRVERNGTTYYRLATPEPQDLPPIYDVEATALVSEHGLVSEYEISYRIIRGGAGGDVAATVDVRVQFTDVGSTTVTEPAWYEDAVAETNGTAANTTTTVPNTTATSEVATDDIVTSEPSTSEMTSETGTSTTATGGTATPTASSDVEPATGTGAA